MCVGAGIVAGAIGWWLCPWVSRNIEFAFSGARGGACRFCASDPFRLGHGEEGYFRDRPFEVSLTGLFRFGLRACDHDGFRFLYRLRGCEQASGCRCPVRGGMMLSGLVE